MRARLKAWLFLVSIGAVLFVSQQVGHSQELQSDVAVESADHAYFSSGEYGEVNRFQSPVTPSCHYPKLRAFGDFLYLRPE